MPKMLNMLNLAGFGLRAWDPGSHQPQKPYFYGSPSLPVFDRNLKNLAEKVRASCVLAHVRGVAYSAAVEISLQNVHPFQFDGVPWALAHNGDLAGMEALKPRLAPHIQPRFLAGIRGTTDSEWIYALFMSQLSDPGAAAAEDEAFEALGRTLAVLRLARADAGVSVSSSVNLFVANGRQLVALRYCFDFGRYDIESVMREAVKRDGVERMHEANLSFLSLWYTLGRNYALHDDEWKMTGGAERAESILVASEPLTRDTSSWVELPEYGALFAEIRNGRPYVSVRLLD
jgi:glutamine amidotransferase